MSATDFVAILAAVIASCVYCMERRTLRTRHVLGAIRWWDARMDQHSTDQLHSPRYLSDKLAWLNRSRLGTRRQRHKSKQESSLSRWCRPIGLSVVKSGASEARG